MKVDLKTYVLENNRTQAEMLRNHFAAQKTLVINITGSPGAGKTTVLERMLPLLQPNWSIAVIEGDVQTSRDAERIVRLGVPAIQINTMGGCHLDAKMIAGCLGDLPAKIDLLIIENVGNLVCPAEYDLGEDFKLTVLSVPEGEDKPLKYPAMFHNSRAVVINKGDLLPYVDYDLDKVMAEIKGIQPEATIFPLSARTTSGVEALAGWIHGLIVAKRGGGQ